MDRVACVEVGGSGSQTVLVAGTAHALLPGAHHPAGHRLALAVPGAIVDGRVTAVNLGWVGADPAAELGLAGPAEVLANDAAAAALGEAALRGADHLVFVGLGTGVGGAVVRAGALAADNLFGHDTGFGELPCPCGRVGCLETVAGSAALPDLADPVARDLLARRVASAVLANPATEGCSRLVAAGGVTAAHPALVDDLARHLPGWAVAGSAAPVGTKSAAAWGLLHLLGLPVATSGDDDPVAAAGSVS